MRRKPVRAAETFGGKSVVASDYVEQPIHTEDYAGILLRYEDGARGTLAVSQVSAGRKNQLSFEIGGSRAALAWDSERPDELWIGHRERANEVLLRDPSLLADAARAVAGYPGGHAEGFPDAFKQLDLAFYSFIASGCQGKANFPTFADGDREVRICEAIAQSAKARQWVNVGE